MHFLVLLIILISIFTFLPVFDLALFGDDWLTIFRYLEHLGPQSPGHWNHFSYFFTPYGPQDIIMGISYLLFGLNAIPYHVLSLTLRIIAGLSFIPLILYLTKNRLAAAIGALLFIVSPVGIEATNWVFNMPSFIAIAFFNFFILFLMKLWERNKITKSIPTKLQLFSQILTTIPVALLFLLTYIWQPIRMHGLVLLTIATQGFWFLTKISTKRAWVSIITLSSVLILFLLVSKYGQSNGAPGSVSYRIVSGFQESMKLLSQGRFDFIFHPVISIGSIFFPENLVPSVFAAGSVTILTKNFLLPFFIYYSFIIFVIIKITPHLKNIFIPQEILMIAWTIVVAITYKLNFYTFSSTGNIILLTIGGYTVIFWIINIIMYSKTERLANGLFISLMWVFLSFFSAWWIFPSSIYLTSHRYLIVASVGAVIFISILFSQINESKQKLLGLILVSLFILTQSISTRTYLKGFQELHSRNTSDKIWASMPYVEEIGKSKEPLVFYFEADSESSGVLNDVVTFGFPPHIAIIYKLREANPIPLALADWKNLESVVTDGKSFYAHGQPQKPIPVTRIYAFRLEQKGNLKDITQPTRKKLEELIKSKNELQ